MISAVIVSLNEAEKLENCLKSISDLADEIIVLDLGSNDKSLQVSREHGAKIYSHSFEPYVEKVRNFAISKTTGDWIIILDPDEIISDKLKSKLKDITQVSDCVAVNIPRKNIFFGKWIAHTNWWPDRHVRFFKKDKVRWSEKIHSYPEVFGKILDLDAKEDLAIVHYGYESISEFIERQNRYSIIEAKNLYDNKVRFSWTMFFWKPTREFLVRFIKHGGFLDGFYGFALVYLMMIYQLQVMVKLWELERQDK